MTRNSRKAALVSALAAAGVAAAAAAVPGWPDGRAGAAPETLPATALAPGQQAPEAGSDADVLARGEGPGGHPLTFVGYRDAQGRDCLGWAGDDVLGLPSTCFPRRGEYNGDPFAAAQVLMGGDGPQGRVLHGFAMPNAARLEVTADGQRTSFELASAGEKYQNRAFFVFTLPAESGVVDLVVKDAQGRTLGEIRRDPPASGKCKAGERPSPAGC